MVATELTLMEEKKNRVLRLQCMNSKCNKYFYSVKPVKYCSETCRMRYHSLLTYNKLKNNEEYRKKAREKSKIYYQENKEELKPKMREYEKEYWKRKKAEKDKKENGNSNKKTVSV